ncbi:signal peptide containing protein [Theileria equi strain WA]|uniref:Signal peptide containing protein n=1 Tax=Theileria equi strain WA TaxID=1537102 RepID=L1LE35_THEEQ|nr:signal peptide containing protein [Theileria equi strain WA]EKX73544.1 signal peptide containing protein [Theileria equi strain WA]|eukprot:XP_004832996.1 signal peptide containing protein [Theileria equi strain WA]
MYAPILLYTLYTLFFLLQPCKCVGYYEDGSGSFLEYEYAISGVYGSEEGSGVDAPGPENSEEIPVDTEALKFFKYTFNDNPMMLIVPQAGRLVVELVSEQEEEIWKGGYEETLKYARAYLGHNEEPELILVVSETPSGRSQKYLELKGREWVFCINHDAKIQSLKVATKHRGDFSMNLQDLEATEHCTIFQTPFLGIESRFYLPEPGYHATEVKDGDQVLWEGFGSDKCSFSTIYFSNGLPHLLHIKVTSVLKNDFYCAKENGVWKIVPEGEFRTMISELRSQGTES